MFESALIFVGLVPRFRRKNKNMIVYRTNKIITRDKVKKNPDVLYLFIWRQFTKKRSWWSS